MFVTRRGALLELYYLVAPIIRTSHCCNLRSKKSAKIAGWWCDGGDVVRSSAARRGRRCHRGLLALRLLPLRLSLALLHCCMLPPKVLLLLPLRPTAVSLLRRGLLPSRVRPVGVVIPAPTPCPILRHPQPPAVHADSPRSPLDLRRSEERGKTRTAKHAQRC